MRGAEATQVNNGVVVDLAAIFDAVRREPTYANHCRALAQLRAQGEPLPRDARRVAVLSNFTVEPVATCVVVQAHVQGCPIELYVAPYNEQAKQILDPASGLHQFRPDVIVIMLSLSAIAPGVVAEPWQDSATRRLVVASGLAELAELLAALRERTRATLVVSNVAPFEASPLGVLDWQELTGVARAVEELNHGLADWAHAHERVYVMDVAGLTATFGRERAFDQRMRLLADQPFATGFLPRLGSEIVRYLRATVGPARKCLVLDLDNTLWGGILGEDGVARLRLGGDAAGEGFREFQQAILALHQRGVLLALCSRNDEAEALAVVREHPGMVLRPEHFATVRVNWLDKVQNLRAVAADLNIGLDSLVFADDDPFERQNVRERLPEVLVVDLPRDPALYRGTLLQLTAFDTLQVTAEDRARSRMYHERRAREQVRHEAGSLESYLMGLAMEIAAVPAEGAVRTRLFQLVHKTNQFNLTNRRYSEAEFDAMIDQRSHRVVGVRVRDRLGDSGVVGLAVLRFEGTFCDIDTFLLSCRVLGRSIETGVLAYIVDLARQAGATQLRGRYVATPKNEQVREFYARHGFVSAGRVDDAEVWQADLADFRVAAPPWARVGVAADGGAAG
ncbi:MAG: HAD-IIIC family phosphatase [Deltaproteobacteria bacterium]|nr:HAD-IIIC family phosphatase [Deltaproteobacteria bacterium]MBI3389737.1 HAD-IIIC family phosphatase [Deltaproteobacteria bacterium]